MVLDVINNKLNIEMSRISIERSRGLRKRKGPGQKPRAIIVTESLTLKRIDHIKKAREQHGFTNLWTLDWKIMFKRNDGNRKVYSS